MRFYILILLFVCCFMGCKLRHNIDSKCKLEDLFSLTTDNPKSIVFKSEGIKSGIYTNYRYYIFFPKEHIFVWYSPEAFAIAKLGYYSFTDENKQKTLHLQQDTKYLKDVKIGKHTNKGSKDSLYFHIKIQKTTNIFPIENHRPLLKVFSYENAKEGSFLADEHINKQWIFNTTDRNEFIIRILKPNRAQKIGIDMELLADRIDFDILPKYNYYNASGHICTIFSNFISLAASDNAYTEVIYPIAENAYQFKSNSKYENKKHLEVNYTWQSLETLTDFEKQYIYALPQYIKALECSGTYPRR